ncbi:apolipoprotein N-acyltransferase [Treponema bryantii]|uniref:apolipoprotein N-acyltransferase n=1 Tax=Treponema bryantii TaxID=163 RepID=UPI002B2C5C7F|nr:apolipoprotein N-acyltransferase 1 [Treponema bryantii]
MFKNTRFINNNFISEVFIISISLLVSVFLFILSQPNPFILNGISFFAWLMLIPILFILSRCSIAKSCVCGFVYGISVCILYALWLLNYHPIALVLVALYEGLLYAVVFVLLKISFDLFEDYSFIIQCLIWCSFEYLRTLGFLGVNYGVIGYSQWNNPVLLQSAVLFGVHGLNFVIIFPSCFFFSFINYKDKKISFIKKHKLSLIGYISVFIALIAYGSTQLKSKLITDTEKTICLVQNNLDTSIYYNDKNNGILDFYKRLVSDAIQENENVDLIVFPEGAVRPRILLNPEDSIPSDMHKDVIDYLQFFYDINIPVVFGSTSLEYDTTRNGIFTYKAYNISCYLDNKTKTIPAKIDVYKKRHLVPIIEKIPFVNFCNNKFLKFSSVFSSGKEIITFPLQDISFCTPICFEESFGYDVRHFMNKHPSFILSISSDLWSKSIVCQKQHLAMEVFRAVENRLPFLRSSVTGQTVYINQQGKIVEMLDPFTSGVITVNVPMLKNPKRTIYGVIGDLTGIVSVLICTLSFIYKIIKIKRRKAK